jgi:heat shock protein HslJ
MLAAMSRNKLGPRGLRFVVLIGVVLSAACSGTGSPGTSSAPPGSEGSTPPGSGTTPPGSAAPAAEGLEGTSWDLKSYLGPAGGTIPPAAAAPAHLAFGARGQVAGSGGCNSFAGTYTVEGTRLIITLGPMTTMACAPAVMAQEDAVTSRLGKVAGFTRDDTTLDLRDASGAVLLNYIAGVNALPGTSWKATGVNNGKGAVETTAATEALTLSFGTSGDFSGFGGCNQLTGPYQTTGDDGLTIGPLTSTRKACGDAVDALEQRFSTALGDVARFEIRGDTLTLRNAGGATQVTATKAR